MNRAPRPVLMVRGAVWTTAPVHHPLQRPRCGRRSTAPAPGRRRDHRVVHRHADDRSGGRRGTPRPLARPARRRSRPPAGHVLQHREHRPGAEGPPEPHRQVEQLRRERHAAALIGALLRSSSPSEGPMSSSRTSVTPPPTSASASRTCTASSFVSSARRTVTSSSPEPGPRPAGSPRRRTAPRACSAVTVAVVENSSSRPPVNSTPSCQASGGDPAAGQDHGHGGQRQPAPGVAHQVRVARGEPRPHPAGSRGSRKTEGCRRSHGRGDRDVGEGAADHQRRRHPGEHSEAERDAEPADRSGGEQEEQAGGEQRRHVRVQDRAPRLDVALPQRPGQPPRIPGGVLLPGTFEDQHVGVDGLARRQQQPGQARKVGVAPIPTSAP